MVKINIREILKAKGISIKDLAAGMGVTPSAVSQLLANQNPSIQQLERIAKAIGVDVMDLFAQDFKYINGYIETGDNIYSVKSREQFIGLLYKIEGIAQIPLAEREDICKNEIKKFIIHSVTAKESGAIMVRDDIKQVFSLSFDAGSKKFSLTQCVGKGEIRFKLIDTTEYLKNDTVTGTEFNQLLEAIHCEIEAV